MIYKLFAIKDRKSNCFDSQVHSFVNADVATRWIYQLVHDCMDSESGRNSAIVAYSEDFELYYLGEFNSQTGEIVYTVPEFVISCDAVKEMSF